MWPMRRSGFRASWPSTTSRRIITRSSRSPAWAAGPRMLSTYRPRARCCPATRREPAAQLRQYQGPAAARDLVRRRGVQPFPRLSLDEGALQLLLAQGDRLWRLPLPGLRGDGRRGGCRSGLQPLAASSPALEPRHSRFDKRRAAGVRIPAYGAGVSDAAAHMQPRRGLPLNSLRFRFVAFPISLLVFWLSWPCWAPSTMRADVLAAEVKASSALAHALISAVSANGKDSAATLTRWKSICRPPGMSCLASRLLQIARQSRTPPRSGHGRGGARAVRAPCCAKAACRIGELLPAGPAGNDGEWIYIIANPADEIHEVWQDFCYLR